MGSLGTQLANRLKQFDFEEVLKCNYFRQVNSVYEYKEEKKAFDYNNDTRRFFYGRCRFVRQSGLTRQALQGVGEGRHQRE